MLKWGTTRVAILVGGVAIKFPRFGYRRGHGWKVFLRGILANMDEAYWFRHSPKKWKDMLCPVMFNLAGIVLVMRRADEIPEELYDKKAMAERFAELPLQLDNKRINFGTYDGRTVLVDYADSRYLCSDCSCIIKECRDK